MSFPNTPGIVVKAQDLRHQANLILLRLTEREVDWAEVGEIADDAYVMADELHRMALCMDRETAMREAGDGE